MKSLISLTFGTCVVLTGTALAADIPLKAPPKPVWTDSWAGYYFGIYFGAGQGSAKDSFTSANTSVRPSSSNLARASS